MNEGQYQKDVIAALEARGWAVQAHNDEANFIPDLSFSANYVDGWIELKWADKLPKTLGSIKHWTKGQEEWLSKRGRAGSGHCYLLLGTPKLHVLWRWTELARVRNMQMTAFPKAPICALTLAKLEAPSLAIMAAQMDGYVTFKG